MVLENVEEITEHNQSPGYEIGDRKLTFKNTYDSKEYGKEKQFTINANDTKSPDNFYYVHVEVDLTYNQTLSQNRRHPTLRRTVTFCWRLDKEKISKCQEKVTNLGRILTR